MTEKLKCQLCKKEYSWEQKDVRGLITAFESIHDCNGLGMRKVKAYFSHTEIYFEADPGEQDGMIIVDASVTRDIQ